MAWTMKVIGVPESQQAILNYGLQLKPVTLDGLVEAVNAVIAQAKVNLSSAAKAKRYVRTGDLAGSLQIFTQRIDGDKIVVEAGSMLPYAFFQEYGWTTHSGSAVSGKLFFTRAIETVRPRFVELLSSTIKARVRFGGLAVKS